jgi:hypothetical protein
MTTTNILPCFVLLLFVSVIPLKFINGFASRSGHLAIQTSQQSEGRGIYGPIPKSLRDAFVERLTLFLKSRYQENWSALYDLLLTRYVNDKTRAQFVADHRKSSGVAGTGHALISFSPTVIEFSSTNQEWTIYGCARLKGIKVKVDAFIIASQEAGEWRFSDIDMLIPRDTAFKKCGYAVRKL